MKSFSKNSNLCDHNSPTLQTDRQTTCDRNTALCTKVHRAVKTFEQRLKILGIPRVGIVGGLGPGVEPLSKVHVYRQPFLSENRL